MAYLWWKIRWIRSCEVRKSGWSHWLY